MRRDDRRRVVADAYDELGASFGEWSARMEGEPLERFVGELAFPDESFDAVTALYSLMHLPRDEHPALLARIRRWLVREAGFDVLVDEVIELREPESEYATSFLWILGRT